MADHNGYNCSTEAPGAPQRVYASFTKIGMMDDVYQTTPFTCNNHLAKLERCNRAYSKSFSELTSCLDRGAAASATEKSFVVYNCSPMQPCQACDQLLYHLVQGLHCHNPVFGSKLEDDVVDGGQDVPRVVVRCMTIVEAWCQRNKPLCVFMYQPTECPEEKEAIKAAFVDGQDEDLGEKNYSPRSYADVLKQYLRELPDPVIPEDMYDQFADFLISGSRESTTMADLVRAMPPRHRSTLEALLRHFTKLLRWQAESDQEETHMTLISEVSHILIRPPWSRIRELRNHIKVYNDMLIEMIRAGCWGEDPPDLPEVLPFQPPAPSPRTDDIGFPPQPPSERLKEAPWYWPGLTKEQAKAIVMPLQQGSFLVRDSSQSGCYVLVLKMNNEVKPVKILCKDNAFGIEEPLEYPSLVTLIDWYRSNSLSTYNYTLTTRLLYPILIGFTPEIPRGSINQQMHVFFMINQRYRKRRAMYSFLRKCHLWLRSDTELKYQAIGAYDELNNMLQEQIESHKKNNPIDHENVHRLAALSATLLKYAKKLKDGEKRNRVKFRLNIGEMATLRQEINELKEQLNKGLDWLKRQGFAPDYIEKLANLDESVWLVDCQRPEAESRLLHTSTGTFLIRPKPEDDAHVLSLMRNGKVEHCMIYHEDFYGLKDDNLCFTSLKEFVDYHHYRPIASDLDVCLLFPVTIYEHKNANSESEHNQQHQAAHPEEQQHQAAHPEEQQHQAAHPEEPEEKL